MNDMDKLELKFYNVAYPTFVSNSKLLQTALLFQDRDDFAPRCYGTDSEGKVRNWDLAEGVKPSDGDKFTTFTPQSYGDQCSVSDRRMQNNPDHTIHEVGVQLGNDFSKRLDTKILDFFESFTGGTAGTPCNPLTWTHISIASALLANQGIRGQVFCVLHPFQWADLLKSASTTGLGGTITPNAVHNQLNGVYFDSSDMGGTTFIVSRRIVLGEGNTAIGAMYVRDAIGLDIRSPFIIRTQRDGRLDSTYIHSSMVYDVGIMNPELGVKIISDASSPEQD